MTISQTARVLVLLEDVSNKAANLWTDNNAKQLDVLNDLSQLRQYVEEVLSKGDR